MPPRRGFPQGKVRVPRRSSSWDAGTGGTTIDARSGSGSAFVGSAITPTTSGLTVVRTRGLLSLMLTLATAAGDGFVGAFGIGLATFAAVTAGIGSVPTPVTEIGDENWLYWSPIFAMNPIVSSAGITRSAFQQIIVDSKAMRKFDDGMAMYAALELVEVGTATIDIAFDSRVLSLLP